MVGKRVVYLKNRIDCVMVRQDHVNIQWSAIDSAQCPITALNSHISDIIKYHVPECVFKVRTQSQSWLYEDCEQAKRKKKDVAYYKWSSN